MTVRHYALKSRKRVKLLLQPSVRLINWAAIKDVAEKI